MTDKDGFLVLPPSGHGTRWAYRWLEAPLRYHEDGSVVVRALATAGTVATGLARAAVEV